MPLVFAGITPHPPLLIPAIGKDNIKKLQKTKDALEKMEEDLYLSKPDIAIIISPHGHHFPDAFSINLSEKFQTDLKEFGDLTTKSTYSGEIQLPYKVRANNYNNSSEAVIISEPSLDYGTAVPLFYLAQHLPDIKIMPIAHSELDAKTHLEFGGLLKELIMEETKRVAVIASGNLSHALSSDAPAGFHQDGAKYDKKIQDLLSSHNTSGMLSLDTELLKNSAECGFRSFMILMGILRDINYRYESYAYEAPFGVGHLTANFVL